MSSYLWNETSHQMSSATAAANPVYDSYRCLQQHNESNPWEDCCNGDPSLLDCVNVALPMSCSVLSLVCGCALIRENLKDIQDTNKRALPSQLILLSVCFIIHSLALLIGPILAPSEIPMIATMGTVESCSFQGFWISFGPVTGSITHFSCVWFMKLMVCQNKTDHELQQHLKYIHAVTFVVGFVLALVPTLLGLINFNGANCWITPFPPDCHTNEEKECIRGQMAPYFRALYFLFPYIFFVFAELCVFYQIYRAVRKLEQRTSRYGRMWKKKEPTDTTQETISGNDNKAPKPSFLASLTLPSGSTRTRPGEAEEDRMNRAKSKAVAYQAFQFTFGITLCVAYNAFEVSLQMGTGKPWLAFDILGDVFISSYNTIHFICFCSSRNQMKTPVGRFLRKLLFSCIGGFQLSQICCCGTYSWKKSALSIPEKKGSPRTNVTTEPTASTTRGDDTNRGVGTIPLDHHEVVPVEKAIMAEDISHIFHGEEREEEPACWVFLDHGDNVLDGPSLPVVTELREEVDDTPAAAVESITEKEVVKQRGILRLMGM